MRPGYFSVHYLFDCRKYGKEFKRMRTVRYVHVKCILPLSTISIPIPFKMCLTRYYNRQFVGGKNVSVLTGTGSVRNVAKSGWSVTVTGKHPKSQENQSKWWRVHDSWFFQSCWHIPRTGAFYFEAKFARTDEVFLHARWMLHILTKLTKKKPLSNSSKRLTFSTKGSCWFTIMISDQ